ncbi:urease subunit beta [Massilia horti]|uniref:Urease subunit beta n=1 Tax=Massilia horti TaxID=2562153 RepID=A0A4Y9SYV0_9BURK|nr:urease subunit beta [Massilia horti]TFW30549.1 urease subunit beta [Massilia horti]
MNPGEWLLSNEPVEINRGRRTCTLKVRNTGDRPIQIGSHFHFFEANRALDFDRPSAMGMHLNLPGGLAVRFEPGDEKEVELVEFSGAKRVVGFNNLVDGGLTAHWTVKLALARARELEFLGMPAPPYDVSGIVRNLGGTGEGIPGARQPKAKSEQENKTENQQEPKS